MGSRALCSWLLVTAVGLHSVSICATTTTRNLVNNPGFEEGVAASGLPNGWSTWVPSGPGGSQIEVPHDVKHSGGSAARIRTTTEGPAFLLSNVIAVAPGEKLTISAWCRAEDPATTGGGTFGIAAGWMDQSRLYLPSAEYTTCALESRDWFQVTREITVPPDAAYMTFQLRHRGITGSTWWDGVEVRPASPTAMRLALPARQMEPGRTTAPVVLINRGAGGTATVSTTPGDIRQQIALPQQEETTVPLEFLLERRGNQTIEMKLLDAAGAVMFSTSARITVPPSLVMEPVLPIYSCVEDGDGAIECRVWVHEPADARNGLRLEGQVARGAQVRATTSVAANAVEHRLKFDLGDLQKLGTGDFVVTMKLLRSGDLVASATQDWHVIHRAQAQVTLSPDGYPIVQGKKTFPMGLYDGHRFEELANAGFNVTQNFDIGHVRRGMIPDNQRMKKILDDSVANDMQHLFLVAHGPGCRVLDEETIRRVEMFKNHPGVLAWYEEEGVARGDVTVSFLRDLHSFIKGAAPEHPLVIGDTRDVIMNMTDRSRFFPLEYLDVGIWWWYPFPIRAGGRPGAYEGEEIGKGLELVPPSFLTLARTEKPIWVVLQSYRKPQGRFPTLAEYRAQPYIAVIHGAKGVFYYTGGGRGGVQQHAEEGNWDYLKQLVSELRDMSPVFMSPDAPDTVTLAKPDALISYRLKQPDNRRFLLAVNRNDRPAEVTFRIPKLRDGEVPVRYEQRNVTAKEGEITDRFAPYGVHVYELETR